MIQLAEVYYFIHICHNSNEIGLALVLLYSRPDTNLFCLSHDTLWSCEYHGDSALRFIDVKFIKSVIAMILHLPVIKEQEASDHFFMVEKLGFDIA